MNSESTEMMSPQDLFRVISETDQKNYPFEGLVTSFYRNFPYYSVEYSTKISAHLFVKSSGLRPRRLKIEHVWGAFPPAKSDSVGGTFL